jgi:hypothetical protein
MSVGEWQCTNEEYHAKCDYVGKSMLDDFRRSRRLYEARYVTRTMKHPGQSLAMLKGTLLHRRLLEPDRYFNSVVVSPRFDKRTKIGKEASRLFQDRADETNRIVVDEATAACIDKSSIRLPGLTTPADLRAKLAGTRFPMD